MGLGVNIPGVLGGKGSVVEDIFLELICDDKTKGQIQRWRICVAIASLVNKLARDLKSALVLITLRTADERWGAEIKILLQKSNGRRVKNALS